MEPNAFESQLELLTFAEQLAIMECLAKLMQRNQQAQNQTPFVRTKKRQFGSAKGKFLYPQDFDEDNEEVARMFVAV